MASVTTHQAEALIDVTRPSGLFASPRPGRRRGDRTEDGVATVENASGDLMEIPYRHGRTSRSASPGTWVTSDWEALAAQT
jgi:hypothetical protein